MVEFCLSSEQSERMTAATRSLSVDWHKKEKNQESLQTSIDVLYKQAGLSSPVILWCKDPAQMGMMPRLLTTLLVIPREYRDGAIKRLQQSVIKNTFSNLLAQIDDKTDSILRKNANSHAAVLGQNVNDLLLKDVSIICKQVELSLQDKLPKTFIGYATNQFVNSQRITIERFQRLIRRLIETPISHNQFRNFQTNSDGFWNRANTVDNDDWNIMGDPEMASKFKLVLEEIDWNLQLEHNLDLSNDLLGLIGNSTMTNHIAWGGISYDPLLLHAGIKQVFKEDLYSGSSDSESIDIFLKVREGALAYMFFSNCVIACELPTKVFFDNIQRIHRNQGAAVEFADGARIACWHGVRIPNDLANNPKLLSVERIERERNAEIRSVMVERMGFERFLKEARAVELSKDQYGTLYEILVRGLEITVVKVRNSTPEPDGSYKDYFLQVPPNMRTAKEAVAWTFNMRERDYNPIKET